MHEVGKFLFDMINLERNLGLILIRVLYFVGLTIIGIYSLILILGGCSMPSGLGAGVVLVGILYLVLGPMMLRIICEVIMAIFFIKENIGRSENGIAEKVQIG